MKYNRICIKQYRNQDWRDYFKLRQKCAAHFGHSFNFKSWEELKQRNTQLIEEGAAIFIILKEEEPIGYFQFIPQIIDGTAQRAVYFFYNIINEKLDVSFMKKVFYAFFEFDPSVQFLIVYSKNAELDFIKNIVVVERETFAEYFVLDVKNANLGTINKWLDYYPYQHEKLIIKFFTELPSDLMEDYCNFYNELLEDLPPSSNLVDWNMNVEKLAEEQENGRKGNYCSYRYLIFDENHKMIAQTNVQVHKNDTSKVEQYMTGVARQYRRLGLSKWLKAAMFKKLLHDFSNLEKILTETQKDNVASRELSKAMGYKRKGYDAEFMLSTNSIKSFLDDQSHTSESRKIN